MASRAVTGAGPWHRSKPGASVPSRAGRLLGGAGGGQLPFNVARGGESAAQRRWRCDGCRRSNGSPFGRRMLGAGGGRARPCQTPGRRQMTWCSRPGPARTGAGSLAGEAHPAAVKLASQSSAAAAATCARSHRRRFSCSAAARRGQRLQVPGHPAQPHRLLVQRGGLLRSVRQHAVEQRPDVGLQTATGSSALGPRWRPGSRRSCS
jgi:hypothetical protein